MTEQQRHYFRARLKEDAGIVRYLQRRIHLDTSWEHERWKLQRHRTGLRIARITWGLTVDEILEVQATVRRCLQRMGAPARAGVS